MRRALPLATLLVATAALAAEAPAPRGLAHLQWLAGTWEGTTGGGDLSEETWSSPRGNVMVGMWRWLEGDDARLFELLTITREEAGVVLRLRHFDARLVGWEEKDAPLILTQVQAGARDVVFAGQTAQGTLRIRYRSPRDGVLEAAVERGGRRDEFTYARRSRPGSGTE